MNTTTTDLLVEAADALVALDSSRLAACYRPDVLLDANVPFWRYQLQGAAAARRSWEESLDEIRGARVVAHRTTPMVGGVAVEIEGRVDGADGEHLWREVHLLLGDAAGVSEHVNYCTGVWTPEQRARQAAEAPMVTAWA